MTTPLTITIDPGKGSGALAWCLGYGRIEQAGLVQGLDPFKVHEAIPSVFIGMDKPRFVSASGTQIRVYPEFMQARGGQSAMHATAKAKSLIDLTAIAFALCGAICAWVPNATVHPVTYQQWSGGATETQVRNRLIGEDGALHPMEVCALDVKRYAPNLRHNLYDAAGMFMFATGRVRPGGW